MWTPSVWRRVARWNCKNGFDPRKTCTEPACIVCLESHIGTVASHYQPLSGLLHCGRWCPQSWWPGTAPGCVLLSSTVYPNFILIQAWVSLARVHGGDGEANAGFLRFRQIMNESRKVELWFCKWGRHGAKTLAKTILLWCSAFWTRMAMTTDLGPCLWTRLSALCCVLKSVCICLHFVSNSWLETISNRVWWKPSIWGRRWDLDCHKQRKPGCWKGSSHLAVKQRSVSSAAWAAMTARGTSMRKEHRRAPVVYHAAKWYRGRMILWSSMQSIPALTSYLELLVTRTFSVSMHSHPARWNMLRTPSQVDALVVQRWFGTDIVNESLVWKSPKLRLQALQYKPIWSNQSTIEKLRDHLTKKNASYELTQSRRMKTSAAPVDLIPIASWPQSDAWFVIHSRIFTRVQEFGRVKLRARDIGAPLSWALSIQHKCAHCAKDMCVVEESEEVIIYQDVRYVRRPATTLFPPSLDFDC